jgi:hypothetical protein
MTNVDKYRKSHMPRLAEEAVSYRIYKILDSIYINLPIKTLILIKNLHLYYISRIAPISPLYLPI